VIIGYTLIILSHFEFLESVSIANSLQNELCETENLIPPDVGFAAENEECWRQ
jgi:hypothetical protein